MNVTFAPLLPLSFIAALILAGLLILIPTLIVKRRGGLMRLLGLAGFSLILLNPQWLDEQKSSLSDIVVVLRDDSASQRLGERPAQTEAALKHIRSAIAKLKNVELRELSLSPNNLQEGTKAFSALDRALANIPPERFAGAIFITDGQIHDVPKDFTNRGYSGPIHALLTGGKTEIDRAIILDEAPRYGLLDKPTRIGFHITQTGINSDAPIPVKIRLSDDSEITLQVKPGEKAQFTSPMAQAGANFVELSIADLPGELNLQNNKAAIITDAIRDRLRVLLVSGEPHAGERTWRNLLKADPSVDLVHFTILRPPGKQDGTPIDELSLIAFPTRELFVDKLDEFDLVIFDRYERTGILPSDYLANVSRYVKQGGAVLISAGPEFASGFGLADSPLMDVLPALPTGEKRETIFKPKLTKIGEKHPVTQNLPGSQENPPSWGSWSRQIGAYLQANAIPVLAGVNDEPLLVLSREEKGRVALLLSDHAWLWARGFEGGGPQGELLRRLAHWLMQEPELEEEALDAQEQADQLVITRKSLSDQPADLTITAPDGRQFTQKLTPQSPGIFKSTIPQAQWGIWRLTDGKLTTRALMGQADSLEMRDVTASAEILKPLIASTKGASFWLEDHPRPNIILQASSNNFAGNNQLGLKANGAYRSLAIYENPLLAGLLGLVLALGLMGSIWLREAR